MLHRTSGEGDRYTVLRPEATLDDVLRACDEAEQYHFASVVVHPYWVPHVERRLANSEVKVGTVVGFPLGATATRVKVYEMRTVVAMGAQEVQAVINISALKSGDMTRFRRDLEEVLYASHLTGLTQEAQTTLTQFVGRHLTERRWCRPELVREIGESW